MARTERYIDIRSPFVYVAGEPISRVDQNVTDLLNSTSELLNTAFFWTTWREVTESKTTEVNIELIELDKRLNYLGKIEPGWLEGKGTSIDSEILARVKSVLEQALHLHVPRPRLFPTPEGGVQMEWTNASNEVSLTLDPDDTICGIRVNVETGECGEHEFDRISATTIAELVLDSSI